MEVSLRNPTVKHTSLMFNKDTLCKTRFLEIKNNLFDQTLIPRIKSL
jgi:hypothetical protein